MLSLHRSYEIETRYDDGPPHRETVRFPSLDWFMCSFFLVLGRLATLDGPRELSGGGTVTRRPDGVVEILERRAPGA